MKTLSHEIHGSGLSFRQSSGKCCRRRFLKEAAVGIVGVSLPLPYRASAEAIASAENVALFSSSNPGLSWTMTKSQKQLYYPMWMEGTWKGQRFIGKNVPGIVKGSVIVAAADVGAGYDQPISFQQRFLPSGEPGGGVVADRIFNVQQKADAMLGYPAVRRVEYDPSINPTRLAVSWATPRKDQSEASVDLRKAEIFINNRSGQELILPEDGKRGFKSMELYRQVTQAAQQGSVGDYMVSAVYLQQEEGLISVRQQIAAFLQPQDALYFDARNEAVAVYNYEMGMKRL